MTTKRKIITYVVGVVAIIAGLLVWSFVSTWRKIPEAYAAWDIGTILVCYLERNDDRWPRSWDDIAASIKPDDKCVVCRGVADGNDRNRGYPNTPEKLKKLVRIDWDYVPTPGVMAYPVTTSSGGKFTVVWGNSEPNWMVHKWLTDHKKDPNF